MDNYPAGVTWRDFEEPEIGPDELAEMAAEQQWERMEER